MLKNEKLFAMKKNIICLILLLSSTLSGCGNNASIEFTGEVKSYQHLGMKCWFIVDLKTGFFYELITTDGFLLNEGRKVQVKAKYTKRETICNMKDRIEVISYKVNR